MSTALVIDPGIRGCGAAILDESVIAHAAYVRSPARKGNGLEEIRAVAYAVADWWQECGGVPLDEVVAEFPQIYSSASKKGDKQKADNNDLLILAGIDGALVASFPTVKAVHYLPFDWKRNLNKEVTEARVKKRLMESERLVVTPAIEAAGSLAHNLWDALGIALHHAGRFAPKRTFVR